MNCTAKEIGRNAEKTAQKKQVEQYRKRKGIFDHKFVDGDEALCNTKLGKAENLRIGGMRVGLTISVCE